MADRAVVLGCGMAGIAAAAALRRAGHHPVVMVERDTLSDNPAPRPGVPQSAQLHNLLACAQVHLETLLPGFCGELVAAGGAAAEVATQTHVYELGLRMPERDLGLRLMSAPRPLIEHVARRNLLRGGGIEIRDATDAVGLEDSAGLAVRVKGPDEYIDARLVVDATGASSHGPRWLRSLGRPEPRVDVAPVGRWYASMTFARPARWTGEPDFWLVFPSTTTRGGLVSPAGDDAWYVSLSGGRADIPPRTVGEMHAYAATLEDPWIADLLQTARPRGAPSLFRRRTLRWRRYDQLGDPLPGFLPIGDAMASLDPLSGQGMSVAAWQAVELAAVIEETEGDPTRAYLARAAEACATAWALRDLVDVTAGGIPGADAFSARLVDDEELHRRYVRVWHLLEPASALGLGSPAVDS